MQCGPIKVDKSVISKLHTLATTAFEIVEIAWKRLDVVLVDFKVFLINPLIINFLFQVEFGVTLEGNIIVADVIDNDSWRIWPKGNVNLMKDKQVYRNIPGPLSREQKDSIMQNYNWVAEQPLIDMLIEPVVISNYLKDLYIPLQAENINAPLVAVIMGSQSDWETMKCCTGVLDELQISYEARIVSAHRTPERMFAFAKSAKNKGFKGNLKSQIKNRVLI